VVGVAIAADPVVEAGAGDVLDAPLDEAREQEEQAGARPAAQRALRQVQAQDGEGGPADEVDQVAAGAAIDAVGLAEELAAEQEAVIAVAADQRVVAAAAIERVGAAQAVQDVVAAAALDAVRALGRQRLAEDGGEAEDDGVGRFGAEDDGQGLRLRGRPDADSRRSF
jgi:hypothetical protein